MCPIYVKMHLHYPSSAQSARRRKEDSFSGTLRHGLRRYAPVIPLVDYIDIEQRFASCAPQIKGAGTAIIASYHSGTMLTLPDLFTRERICRKYGDIVKIIVTPENEEDVLELIAFTHAVKKPVCTGVMGARFRYARAMLPLFGSSWFIVMPAPGPQRGSIQCRNLFPS